MESGCRRIEKVTKPLLLWRFAIQAVSLPGRRNRKWIKRDGANGDVPGYFFCAQPWHSGWFPFSLAPAAILSEVGKLLRSSGFTSREPV